MTGSRVRWTLCAALAGALAGCGGGGQGGAGNATGAALLADQTPAVADVSNGASPFIAFVVLPLPALENLSSVHFRVEPKPGSVSRPVDVDYAIAYLEDHGYATEGSSTVKVPVFGLYADYANQVDIDLTLENGTTLPEARVEVDTPAYTDPNGIYDRPTILKSRTASATLGFDYFYVKSSLGSPVVIDTDGQVRWAVPKTLASSSSLFVDNHFIIGDSGSPIHLRRLELDGTAQTTAVNATDLTDFHHNIDPGKAGLLASTDNIANGVSIVESTLVELDPNAGTVLKRWELGDILSRFMQAQGDDPTQFVRPGTDWFHLNSATYDRSDDTLLVSSRENFVMKIDYASGDLIWILGDPTKYWHGFPSLAGMDLSLDAGGLYPIGQHALSISHDGLLLLFNDGQGSFNQPGGAPGGETRTYSAVSAYAIDAAHRSATEARRFDYGQSIFSGVCSSVYEAPADASMLVSYAVADNDTHARLVGLDVDRNVVFDFQYATTGCNTSWNAQPIPFESMHFGG